MIRSLAQLDLKVTDMRAGLDSVENTTRWNSHSLRNLAVSINQIKVKAPTDYLTFYYGTFQQDNFGSVNSTISSISAITTETSMVSSTDETVKDEQSTRENVQQN